MTSTPKTSLVKLLAKLPGPIIPVFSGFERDVSDVPSDSPHIYPVHKHIFTSDTRNAKRGPDNGSEETMEVYELPEAMQQF